MFRALKVIADSSLSNIKDQVKDIDLPGKNTSSEAVLSNVINMALYVVGIIAVVMIIVAGVQMATSAGDPRKVAKAKSTMIYSVIGLLVAILAYAIVNFVIGKVTG